MMDVKAIALSNLFLVGVSSLRLNIAGKDHWPDWRTSDNKVPLFVFPGFGGNSEWLGLMQKNLESLDNQIGRFDCIVFQYKTSELDPQHVKPCRIMNNHVDEGHLWTFWMKQVSKQDVESHSHVALLIEDVDISQVHVEKQLRIMTFYNATISCPAFDEPNKIPGHYHHHIMEQYEAANVGRWVTYIDPQFMIFTPEKYTCWQDMIDLDVNPIGWGYDRLVHSVCDASMVILDHIGIGHHMGSDSSYDTTNAQKQERAIISKYENLGYHAVANTHTGGQIFMEGGEGRTFKPDDAEVFVGFVM